MVFCALTERQKSPALCEFSHHSISRLQRKPGLAGRTAACQLSGEGPVWAVLGGDGAPQMRKCCDRSNGNEEPKMTDAANCTNGRFG